ETRAHEVSALLELDRSLGLLFALIAALGGAGYLLSLGVGLYANVERARRQLAQLRLLGLRRGEVVLLPMLQAGLLALAGAALAAGLGLLAAEAINRLDLSRAGGRAVCVILPWHVAVAFAATLAGAMIAAAAAGLRAGRVAPAEGIRDE
ncbi:MAG: FtsX-like permease family protein, partial [Acetobacteraceae bacterium]|nr:FtsX-like permease family protein [Acetobacteraceae bacterium]